MQYAAYVGGLLASYLLGSVPFGLLLARSRGIDIRQHGSGNIGATNVFRVVGKGVGITTFVLDFLKGFVPALLFPVVAVHVSGQPVPALLGLACGCAAIAGHNWPIFLKFRGGKGVATSAGMLTGAAPAAVGVGLAAWVVLFVSSRYVSVASIGAALCVGIAGWFFYMVEGWGKPLMLTILALLVIWRHRANLARLIRGEENRFNFKSRKKEALS
jgi:glycerol-3-phosphate acyltransferase PlsY